MWCLRHLDIDTVCPGSNHILVLVFEVGHVWLAAGEVKRFASQLTQVFSSEGHGSGVGERSPRLEQGQVALRQRKWSAKLVITCVFNENCIVLLAKNVNEVSREWNIKISIADLFMAQIECEFLQYVFKMRFFPSNAVNCLVDIIIIIIMINFIFRPRPIK